MSIRDWDLAAITAAIADSYEKYSGVELIARTGDPDTDARALMELDAVVLSHDGGLDPVFVYANQAAARLWRMPVDELVGMQSRLSAAPEHRAARASMLSDAAASRILYGYRGERVASDGTRFVIEDATLWTVDSYPDVPGQAVVFSTWHLLDG